MNDLDELARATEATFVNTRRVGGGGPPMVLHVRYERGRGVGPLLVALTTLVLLLCVVVGWWLYTIYRVERFAARVAENVSREQQRIAEVQAMTPDDQLRAAIDAQLPGGVSGDPAIVSLVYSTLPNSVSVREGRQGVVVEKRLFYRGPQIYLVLVRSGGGWRISSAIDMPSDAQISLDEAKRRMWYGEPGIDIGAAIP